MSNERLLYLFERYIAKSCSAEEKEELSALALAAENEDFVRALLHQYWIKDGIPEKMPEENAQLILSRILTPEPERSSIPLNPHLRKPKWYRLIAASVILVITSVALFYMNRTRESTPVVKKDQQHFKNDIAAPAQNKAQLTLANGKTIILDTAMHGILSGNANKMSENVLEYSAIASSIEYHMLTVPAGSRPMQLKLSDGTEVWVNVGSSVTYPNAFAGIERKVSITGEVYFEVAKNEKKKFFVTSGKTTTEVLGTHFNINSYPDENQTRVTLLEGSIKVADEATRAYRVLTPGQQAQVTADPKPITVLSKVDTDEVMAWKNGMFQFQRSDLRSIMRQVARWYDVEIIFEKEITSKFGGTIPMNVNLSQMLSMLEATGHVHFSIEGKTVRVLP